MLLLTVVNFLVPLIFTLANGDDEIRCFVGQKYHNDQSQFTLQTCQPGEICETKYELHGDRFIIHKACTHEDVCDTYDDTNTAQCDIESEDRICRECCDSNRCNGGSDLPVGEQVPPSRGRWCEVGHKSHNGEHVFTWQRCPLGQYCETKFEIHEDRRSVHKSCQTDDVCDQHDDQNAEQCYIESEDRLCQFCCDINFCNWPEALPASNGDIEETLLYRSADLYQENFDRTWAEYRNGFGNRDGEFWWGLESAHRLTQFYDCDIKVFRYPRSGVVRSAGVEKPVVEHITIGNENVGYRFRGIPFGARDQSLSMQGVNCASTSRGGWWYEAWRRCRGGSGLPRPSYTNRWYLQDYYAVRVSLVCT